MLGDFGEMETLLTCLEGFKETVENRITSYESLINNAIRKDWNEYENKMVTSQHTRNREIIQEIVQNSQLFLDENNKKFEEWAKEDED